MRFGKPRRTIVLLAEAISSTTISAINVGSHYTGLQSDLNCTNTSGKCPTRLAPISRYVGNYPADNPQRCYASTSDRTFIQCSNTVPTWHYCYIQCTDCGYEWRESAFICYYHIDYGGCYMTLYSHTRQKPCDGRLVRSMY